MNYRILYLAFLVLCSIFPIHANDSIRTDSLHEIEVIGQRRWIENGIINIIPTKKQKHLSNSPASLIGNLHLSFLKEKDGNIVNMAGQSVTIYINGEKANEIDISTFWPSQVKRIEYIENPTDPIYEGNAAVVNFTTSKYLFGGITRLNLIQRVPNYGYYNAASKFAYKI